VRGGEIEGEVKRPWASGIEERRPRLVGAPARAALLCSARARGRRGGEGEHGRGEDKAGGEVADKGVYSAGNEDGRRVE